MTTPTAERYVVTRTLAATPAQIFAVLADPTRHQDTEPGDWVRDSIDTDRITRTGQMFAVNMFLERAGGHWQVVWSDEPAAKPGRKVSKKKEPAPLQALGFSLDELKEARLASVIDFKGRKPRAQGE